SAERPADLDVDRRTVREAEDARGDPEPLVVTIDALGEGGVGRAAEQRSDLVEARGPCGIRVVAWTELASHRPLLPGQQLLLVESRDVQHHVADGEPRPGEAQDGETEPGRIERTRAHAPPRRRSVDELVAGHVAGREADTELAHRGVVELGVEKAPFGTIPVLADPVVF